MVDAIFVIRKHQLEIVNLIDIAAGGNREVLDGPIKNIISDLDNSSNKYKHSDSRADNDKYSDSTQTATTSKTSGMDIICFELSYTAPFKSNFTSSAAFEIQMK